MPAAGGFFEDLVALFTTKIRSRMHPRTGFSVNFIKQVNPSACGGLGPGHPADGHPADGISAAGHPADVRGIRRVTRRTRTL